MRTLPVLLFAGALCACKNSPPAEPVGCPAAKVTLDDWPRGTARYVPVSFAVPPMSVSDTIPTANGARGEKWDGSAWHIYYRIDSVRTDRVIEKNDLVHDFMTCTDSIGGHPAVLTMLYSTATSMKGQVGQGTWTLPDHRTFYLALLTSDAVAKDTMLAILRSVKFDALNSANGASASKTSAPPKH